MTSRTLKRRASTELTSNSVVVLQPVADPNNMITITSAISTLWTWTKKGADWCGSLIFAQAPGPAPLYTTMSYTSNNINADTHIQSSQTREDGTTTLKRHKMRPKASRSRSAGDPVRKGGRGKLDYTGCFDDEDIKQRNEDYWAPPDFGISQTMKYESPRSPPASLSGDEQDQNGLHMYRRHSDSFLSPLTPESMSPSRSHEHQMGASTFSRKSAKSLRNKLRTSGNGTVEEISLEERMRLLLVGHESEKDETPLHPSKFIVEKRTRLANERKIRERAEAARAARELRLHRRFPRKDLVQKLDAKWEDRVTRAEDTNNHHHVITTSIGGTELRIKDFRTLLGKGAWLNDEIVNSYLEWIVDAANKAANAESAARGEKASDVPKFIAHNSFFYNNLDSKGAGSTERLMKRKKAPGRSLMEVDSVFVPICKGNHWTVGVVRPVAKTIEYFDSFGGSSQRFIALMRSWLEFQLGDAYVEGDWEVPITRCAPQSNGFDCGVFVCTNSLCVALGLDTLCYRQEDLGQQRRNIAAILINKGFTGDFSWTNEWF